MFKQANTLQYRIKRSKYGVGLFAIKKINKGDKLNFSFEDIKGNYYDKDEVEKYFNKEQVSLLQDYFFSLGGKIFVPDDMSILTKKLKAFFFLNHSDTPNVEINTIQETAIAKKDININEELLADYNHKDYRLNGDKFIFNKDKRYYNIKYTA